MAANQGQYSFLRDVDHTKTTWAVRVKVVRAYEMPPQSRGGQRMELVFIDSQGDKIHGLIKRPQLRMFRSKIVENGVYAIRDFLVMDNYYTYKATNHAYLIEFYGKTIIKDINPDIVPNTVFDFQPFEVLQTLRVVDDKQLIDVIGKVAGKCTAQNLIINGRGERLMELALEDAEGNRLGCTLWNSYIDNFLNYYENHKEEGIFVIVQMCRARRYKGTISVGTSYDASKLIINGNTSELVDFMGQFPAEERDNGTLTTFTANSQVESREYILGGNLSITTIADLVKKTEEGVYWILGDVVSIENFREWCYLSCNTCNKKLQADDERFVCLNCNLTLPDGILRYKVTVCVMDDSGHSSFTLWDRECLDMLGKTAADLRNEVELRTGDPMHFPEDIESIIEKRGLFKVQLKNKAESSSYKGPISYGVITMIRDDEVLKVYENPNENGKGLEEISDMEKSGSTADNLEGTIPQKKSVDIVDLDKEVEDGVTPTQTKRKSMRLQEEETLKRNLMGQFSTNGKKLKTKIKKEPE
ncbi:unnamed protein product [Cuscuta epithymum]|uniref:Replication factor A C-terminal domain-containing protein n=1 Tax=Cuscuta epithymum TaxID=186058 RepID=A0AAV0C9N8_9ASTE|nr:unnamed protein product [Cuscuta epithymum]CAH9068825.1 unnamed protein product [Cuscuta epithymum]CAH9127197.1 unnamed protein product [Cuscuta epithymum]